MAQNLKSFFSSKIDEDEWNFYLKKYDSALDEKNPKLKKLDKWFFETLRPKLQKD